MNRTIQKYACINRWKLNVRYRGRCYRQSRRDLRSNEDHIYDRLRSTTDVKRNIIALNFVTVPCAHQQECATHRCSLYKTVMLWGHYSCGCTTNYTFLATLPIGCVHQNEELCITTSGNWPCIEKEKPVTQPGKQWKVMRKRRQFLIALVLSSKIRY